MTIETVNLLERWQVEAELLLRRPKCLKKKRTTVERVASRTIKVIVAIGVLRAEIG